MLDPNTKSDMIVMSSVSAFRACVSSIRVQTKTYTSKFSLRPHYHDYPQLWYCKEGEYTHETEYGEYLCGPGSILTVSPGVLHRFFIPEGQKVTLIRIDFSYDCFSDISYDVAKNSVSTLLLPPFLRPLGIACTELYQLSDSTQIVLKAALELFHDSETKDSEKKNAIEQFFSQLEFSLADRQKKRVAEIARMRLYPVLRALSYIHANYSRKITAEQICEVSNLCRTNLFTLIKQYLGISYSTYLTMIRVFRAHIALVHTNYSLAYISDMCGFSGSSYFGICYKKYRGVLPKDVRAQQKLLWDVHGKLHITHEYFRDDFYE